VWNFKDLKSICVLLSRSSPSVLGTGPKPCKGYSAIVLPKGRILVIKKGSASDDSIWFLEVSIWRKMILIGVVSVEFLVFSFSYV